MGRMGRDIWGKWVHITDIGMGAHPPPNIDLRAELRRVRTRTIPALFQLFDRNLHTSRAVAASAHCRKVAVADHLEDVILILQPTG